MHAWAATPCARTHSRRRRAGIHKAGQCRYTTPRTDTQVEQGCIAHLSQANAPSHALAHDATHPHAHRLHPSPKPSTARAHRQTTSRDDAAHTRARAWQTTPRAHTGQVGQGISFAVPNTHTHTHTTPHMRTGGQGWDDAQAVSGTAAHGAVIQANDDTCTHTTHRQNSAASQTVPCTHTGRQRRAHTGSLRT